MIDSYYDCFKRSLTDTARIGLRKQQPATRSRVAAPIASEPQLSDAHSCSDDATAVPLGRATVQCRHLGRPSLTA